MFEAYQTCHVKHAAEGELVPKASAGSALHVSSAMTADSAVLASWRQDASFLLCYLLLALTAYMWSHIVGGGAMSSRNDRNVRATCGHC